VCVGDVVRKVKCYLLWGICPNTSHMREHFQEDYQNKWLSEVKGLISVVHDCRLCIYKIVRRMRF